MNQIICPQCKKTLAFKPEQAGKKVKCPKCGESVQLDGPPERTPSQPAAARRGLWLLIAGVVVVLAAGGMLLWLKPAKEIRDQDVLDALEAFEPKVQKTDDNGRVIDLKLEGRHVHEPALDEVSKLTALKSLSLYAASLTDDGLLKLQKLKKLESLGLGETLISDTGLVHIEKMYSLRWIWLPKSKVTQEGVDQLKRKLPGLTVYLQ